MEEVQDSLYLTNCNLGSRDCNAYFLEAPRTFEIITKPCSDLQEQI